VYPLQLHSMSLPRWPKLKQLELVTVNTAGSPMAAKEAFFFRRRASVTVLSWLPRRGRNGSVRKYFHRFRRAVTTLLDTKRPRWVITANVTPKRRHRIGTTVIAVQKVGQPPTGNVIRRPDIPNPKRSPLHSEALPRFFSDSETRSRIRHVGLFLYLGREKLSKNSGENSRNPRMWSYGS